LSFIRPFENGPNYYLQKYSDICNPCKDSNNNPTCVNPAKTSYVTSDYSCCEDICGKALIENEINTQVFSDVQIQLAALFVTAIVIQNLVEIFLPYVKNKLRIRLEQREAQLLGRSMPPRSDAEEQMELAQYLNTIDDMSEIIIQFGYVTMFVIALPITPLLTLINNIVELRVDGYKILNESQRPHPNGSSGIGAWNGVMSFFSIVAVGTNVALITWRTTLVSDLISSNAAMKWVFFYICVYFLGFGRGCREMGYS